jgi:putative ABC transport system permease protein
MTQFLEAVSIALRAIWASKLRSFLTVLGNIVAVTSVIAVWSLVKGMDASVTSAIVSEFSADTFSIDRRGLITNEDEWEATRNNPRVTMQDADAVRRLTTLVSSVMATSYGNASIRYREHLMENVDLRGVTREYMNFSNYTLEKGRPISPTEIDRNRPVALLGWEVANRLFKEVDPVDKQISIGGIHFRVAGVAEKKGSMFGSGQDEYAIVPIGAVRRFFGSRQSLMLTVKPIDPSVTKAAMEDTRVALRVRRGLKPKEKDNFGLISSETFLNLYESITKNIFAVLIGVVALSLVVGGIVIMNIMLMVVTERTQEIGLRKALGARRIHIIFQILVESVTLSLAGGVAGTALGFLAAFIVSKATPLPMAIYPSSVVLGIGITAVVGLFFGVYPAMRAASLDPIEALRKE